MDFEPVVLSAEDDLPVPLRLVLRYEKAPAAEALGRGVRAALAAFPHLTGKLVADDGGWRIEPRGDVPVLLRETQCRTCPAEIPFVNLRQRFFPPDEDENLFSLAVAREAGGGAWLSFSVSHRAVDGTGMALFFAHMGAAIHGFPAPEVRHDRACKPACDAEGISPPDGYGPAAATDGNGERAMAEEPLVFLAPRSGLECMWGALPQVRERFRLTAWLCSLVSSADARLDRAAVWCNARVPGCVPRTFTGNAGCYLPIGKVTGIEAGLAALATPAGVKQTAAVYRRVSGGRAAWRGFSEGFIQCNLVPAPSAVADLGTGPPVWGTLLSRNSAGLRLTPSADGAGWIVECSFAPRVLATVRETVAERLPAAEFWNGGPQP